MGRIRIEMSRASLVAGLAVAMMSGMEAAPALAQETATINAFSVWQAKAVIAQSGEHKAVLSGVFMGTLFIETNEGPVDAGTIGCPGSVTMELDSGRQKGSGACSFTAHDGARAFGEWSCVGANMVGCRGEFRLTGGTGRLAGASGSGTILVRGRMHELTKIGGGMITDNAVGIAVWRDLKVTTAVAAPK